MLHNNGRRFSPQEVPGLADESADELVDCQVGVLVNKQANELAKEMTDEVVGEPIDGFIGGIGHNLMPFNLNQSTYFHAKNSLY